MGRYIAAHDRAICRIGMQPCRERGTKPHSHRHSYARWLHKLGLPREQIRRYLHHASLASQEVYKQLDDGEMNLAMEVALAQMNEAGKPEVYSEGVAAQGAISPVSGSVAARLFDGIKQVLAED